MKEFKFFQKEERVFTQWMDEMDDWHLGGIRRQPDEPTIYRYDDYDEVVLDRIRYIINPVAQVHRFEINGGSKAIIIRDIVQNPNLPLVEIVYELYHIYPHQPNIMHNRIITMSVDEYNEVRYETL